jgi:hypothetical protein
MHCLRQLPLSVAYDHPSNPAVCPTAIVFPKNKAVTVGTKTSSVMQHSIHQANRIPK